MYYILYFVYIYILSCIHIGYFPRKLYDLCMPLRKPAEATTDRVCIFLLFSMVVSGVAEVTTHRVLNLYCFSKIRKL